MGFAILESYSRVLESLAFNVMSRIEDVIVADNVAREKAKKDGSEAAAQVPDGNMADSMTLLDFMGWNGDADGKPDDQSPSAADQAQDDGRLMKLPNIMTNLKQTYMDVLGGPGRT